MLRRILSVFVLLLVFSPVPVATAQSISPEKILELQRQIDLLREAINKYIQAITARQKTAIHSIQIDTDPLSGTARIDWVTTKPVKSRLYYSLTSPVTPSGAKLIADDNFRENHSVHLSGLGRGSGYSFIIEAIDANNSIISSSEQWFALADDRTAPKISLLNWQTGQADATLTWTTDEPATSQVFYGQSSVIDFNHSLSVYQPELVQNHSIKIPGLSPNTTYYFIVRSQDFFRNAALSAISSFKTMTPDSVRPEIYWMQASQITDKEAVIDWSTNEPTTGRVYYDTIVNPQTSPKETDISFSSFHSVKLKDLIPNTNYQYIIEATDEYKNDNRTYIGVFTTLKDFTNPKLSDIKVFFYEPYRATVTWNTDEKTTGSVYYSTSSGVSQYFTGPNNFSATDSKLETSHSVSVALYSNTTYYFKVEAKDISGNASISDEFSLKTP